MEGESCALFILDGYVYGSKVGGVKYTRSGIHESMGELEGCDVGVHLWAEELEYAWMEAGKPPLRDWETRITKSVKRYKVDAEYTDRRRSWYLRRRGNVVGSDIVDVQLPPDEERHAPTEPEEQSTEEDPRSFGEKIEDMVKDIPHVEQARNPLEDYRYQNDEIWII